jgi:hypothetical protein
MSELNFPTKLIRHTKATLTIVMYVCICWKLSYDEQTYKQPAQSTKRNTTMYSHMPIIDIVGKSQSAVRDTYLNLQKTKYMIVAWNDTTIRDVGQSVAIGDKHFEVVKEFVYLGSLMTPTNDVSLEIQRRIQTSKRCFFGLRKHLQLSHLLRQTKFTIYKALISTAVRSGC